MSDDSVQSFANHRRSLFPYHFIAVPILSGNIIVQGVAAARAPGLDSAWSLLVSAAILLAFVCARWMARRVQDRVIRLEETLRLERLLPGRAYDIEQLSLGQFIGIRFASDAEVPHLMDRITSGELVTRGDVKRAVQHWRPDHLRA